MRRLTGLCALNMGTFLNLFYTPVMNETSVTEPRLSLNE
jgi:hypothetical protein